MLWSTWSFPESESEPELDRDRKVTLTIEQLTDALAEALKVVSSVTAEPQWKKGDRAFVEVEVTDVSAPWVHFKLANFPSNAVSLIPADLLTEIQ